MVRRIRLILASVVFLLISLLFLDVTGTLHHWLGWLAKIQFLPALLALNVGVLIVLVVVTLLLGRVYCSVICPLGIFQDLVAWLHNRRKKNRYRYSTEKKWIRYPVLALFIAAFVAGIGSVVALFAPYSSYGRMVTNLLKPLYQLGNNLLATLAEHFNSYAFYAVDVWMKSLPTFVVALITLVVIVVLAWRGGRTYCNTICPVGTMLSFLARFSWYKVRIDADKCRKCGKCSRSCKASCIDSKQMTVDYSRCVVCGNCLEQCRFDALHYCHAAKKKEAKTVASQGKSTDEGRRAFLVSGALLTAAVAFSQEKKKVDGGLAVIEDKVKPHRLTPIVPAGALSAKNMAKRCTGCQLCVSQCPNNVLRPSENISTLMQPTMSYEQGYCRPECNRCSTVCPTGAIQPITLEDKSSTQIGHAVWVKKNCLPVADGVACGNCARHCPVGAIMMVALNEEDEHSPMIPAVDESRCIGCGVCEHLCPARPFSAIYVEGHEVHRTL